MTRICFLNPFGTDAYDELIHGTITPSLRDGTEVVIRHLTAGPRNIDYYVPKHLVEVEILRAALAAERDGFDAFVIGCCYDPALAQARELLRIPVVGPLEASVLLSRLFGHRFAVVTDHNKAVPEIEDRIRLYGIEPNCRGVSEIGWFVEDMVKDPARVARDLQARSVEVAKQSGAEVIVVGCTIIAACYEQAVLRGLLHQVGPAIVNPNLMAIKVAEMLADLDALSQYRIARTGYYQRHDQHDSDEAESVRQLLEPEQLTNQPVAFTAAAGGKE